MQLYLILFLLIVSLNDPAYAIGSNNSLNNSQIAKNENVQDADNSSIMAIPFNDKLDTKCTSQMIDSMASILIGMECVNGVWSLSDTIICGNAYIRRAIILNKKPDLIWSFLTDTCAIKGFMPNLSKYEIIEDYADSQRVMCIGKPHPLLKSMTSFLIIRFTPCAQITWSQYKGKMDELRGSWTLIRLANERTLAIYSICFEPGWKLIPHILIKNRLKTKVDEMLQRLKSKMDSG